MENTQSSSLEQQLEEAQRRASDAERRLEVAKRELVNLCTDTSAQKLAESEARLNELEAERDALLTDKRELTHSMTTLGQEVQRWRVSYLGGELDKSLLQERVEEAEERLASVVKPLSQDDQRLVQERSLSWMALKDPLTNLHNGNKLDIQLEWSVQEASCKDELVVLMVLDIDRFHAVNEFAGWRCGNALLVEVADRLRELVKGSETFLARRGEDEYAVIFTLESVQSSPAAAPFDTPLIRVRQLADLVLQIFEQPFELAGQRLPLKASMGLCVYPNDCDNSVELLENAHVALAAAKESKRGSYLFFNDQLYSDKEHRVGLGTELTKAIIEGEIRYLYRPLVGVARGTLAAACIEAYWDHPSHGRVSQADFMQLAESLGLAHKIAEQSLGAALDLARKVRGSIPALVSFPASILGRADSVKQVLDAVGKAKTRPEALIIDLPSEALVKWPSEARRFFEELSKWRIGVSISDIGAASIPLLDLQSIRPSMIELSSELTQRAPHSDSQTVLSKSLLALLKQLGLPSRVSQVADKSQAHFLALHDCDYASGDFLAPAASLEEFVARKRTTWTFR